MIGVEIVDLITHLDQVSDSPQIGSYHRIALLVICRMKTQSSINRQFAAAITLQTPPTTGNDPKCGARLSSWSTQFRCKNAAEN